MVKGRDRAHVPPVGGFVGPIIIAFCGGNRAWVYGQLIHKGELQGHVAR